MYRSFGKNFIDLAVGLLGLIVLMPVFVLVLIILFFANRGSIFFTQPRPGKGGKIFNVIKFKTMNDSKDANGNLLPDEYRLTGIGRFVRRKSLDEIPQLLNVIKGEMSLVGPRPLLVEYLPLYNKRQARRHQIKPGITGWAQVNGRNAISWEQKFDYDIWYVDNISFLNDLKIILMTVKRVFQGKGINSNTSMTMEKFNGTI